LEWELPETRAVGFIPSLEDVIPIRMNDKHCCLGEKDRAVKVGKWAQADEGMGEGGHHVALHCCRGKGWGARVPLATDLTERPFATWTPTAGAHGFRLKTGALGAK
jgi:hypothetical protein